MRDPTGLLTVSASMHADDIMTAQAPARAVFLWAMAGAALIGLAGVLVWMSLGFGYAFSVGEMPVLALAALLVMAGLLFCFAVPTLVRRSPALGDGQLRNVMIIVIAAGLAARLVLFASEPMLEDDYQRYLWDGAVAAHGLDPYGTAPASAAKLDASSDLGRLAAEAGVTLKRINHPELTTVYPPVAQAAFALAHFMKPWSLTAWRAVALAADVATLVLLLALLKSVGQSQFWAALYWWNPLVLKELFNSAHMDVITVALVLGALLFAARKRPYFAATVLAAGVGTKVWPVLLLPIVLRASTGDRRTTIGAALLFAALSTLVLSPMLMASVSEVSGLAAYVQDWKSNSALFPALEKLASEILSVFGFPERTASLAVRGFLALTLGGLALAMAWRPISEPRDLVRRAAVVIAALVLLSPAQYPWYYVWFAPFLAFQPWPGMLALTATLPLYYTSFYFIEHEQTATFHGLVVWLIWVPAWTLLAWQFAQKKRGQTAPA